MYYSFCFYLQRSLTVLNAEFGGHISVYAIQCSPPGKSLMGCKENLAPKQGFDREHNWDFKQKLMRKVCTSFSGAKQKKCSRERFLKEVFFLTKELFAFAKLFCGLNQEGCPSNISLDPPIFSTKHFLTHWKIKNPDYSSSLAKISAVILLILHLLTKISDGPEFCQVTLRWHIIFIYQE